MKSQPSFSARLATLSALTVIFLSLTSAAAPHPLNYPQGLAVAANGNLYVANNNGDQILVYNPAHVQLTAKTITQGISHPSAVAFDVFGTLAVANTGNNSITEYTPAGVQYIVSTVTNGIFSPSAIAFDGLNDLWVNNGYVNLSIYPAQRQTPIVSINETAAITGIAAYREFAVLGTNTQASFIEISPLLAQNPNGFVSTLPDTCFAAAYDSAGTLYCANQDFSLTSYTGKGQTVIVKDMGFFPLGLAVDKTRGLIYVSSGPANSIAVYSTSGTLLTTIK